MPYRVRNILRKEKLLVTSNFSFSHNVFLSYISQCFLYICSVSCGNGLSPFCQSTCQNKSNLAIKITSYNSQPHVKSVSPFPNKPWFLCVYNRSTSLENTVRKGEIASNEQFLLFPQCFPPAWRIFFHFHQIWNCRLQTVSVWKNLKFVVRTRVKGENLCQSKIKKTNGAVLNR